MCSLSPPPQCLRPQVLEFHPEPLDLEGGGVVLWPQPRRAR